jgi:hypothetical protein
MSTGSVDKLHFGALGMAIALFFAKPGKFV